MPYINDTCMILDVIINVIIIITITVIIMEWRGTLNSF